MSNITAHGAVGSYEPELQHVFLPRCPICHGPHPRALGIDGDECCGHHIATGRKVTVRGQFGGLAGVLARVMFWIARGLMKLARSI